MSKTCTKCGETKELEMFHKLVTGKGGVNPQCKLCICADRVKWWREASQETRDRYNARHLVTAKKRYKDDDDFRNNRRKYQRERYAEMKDKHE